VITFIYGLVDPETRTIRYVGKSNDPYYRLRAKSGHVEDARRGFTYHKSNWIRSLLSKGLVPEVIILEPCLKTEWSEREKCWIKTLREKGFPLTNIHDGGDQPSPVATETLRENGKKLAHWHIEHPDLWELAKKKIGEANKVSLLGKRQDAAAVAKRVATRRKNALERRKKQHIQDTPKGGYVICALCGAERKSLAGHLTRGPHYLTGEEFQNYRSVHQVMCQATIQKKSDSAKKNGNGLLGKKRGPYKKRIQSVTVR
jgi:hypothetical protein